MGEGLWQLTEAERVESWRLYVLLNLGFDADAAERLASSEADLHRVASLLSAGCSHELAAEIAA